MTILYKLTDKNGFTQNNTKWGECVTHTAAGIGPLCSPRWLHAYTNPLLAVLLNPIHANIKDFLLWKAEGDVGQTDKGLKVGCTILTTLHTITPQEITTEQRVKFGILCALSVYREQSFVTWANNWLNGADRAAAAAYAAAAAAYAAADAAADAAYAAAADAAYAAAADAAYAAAYAADAAGATGAAACAASAAACAAAAAAVNLIDLAVQAVA